MPFFRRIRRHDDNDLDALVTRIAELEAELGSTREDVAVLWALAPIWITGPIPYARANGWTITATQKAIVFEHEGLHERWTITLPLPERAEQRELQAELHSRLGYIGPTGLEGVKPPHRDRRRIVDFPE